MADESYIVMQTNDMGTSHIGPFRSEEDAQEFVRAEQENGSGSKLTVDKLLHPSTSPVQAPGRWDS